MSGDLVKRSKVVRERILKWTRLPCGVGIGSTKTLAKLANHIAKSAERKPGSYPSSMAVVCSLAALPASELDALFQATEVGEVWSVGRRIGKQLNDAGVRTVLDLVRLSPSMVRDRWSAWCGSAQCASFKASPASAWRINLTPRNGLRARAALARSFPIFRN